MSAKRARAPPSPAKRVVLNVGGTLFHTTLDTAGRSVMLAGMLDISVWDEDPKHCEEIFLDRDPALFTNILGLMRQGNVMGAALDANDFRLSAAILAEADFWGIEHFLQHVRATAWRNETGKTAAELDDEAADAAFIENVGSIQDALASGFLPRRYFTRSVEDRKIVQLIPREQRQFMQFVLVSRENITEDHESFDADTTLDVLQPLHAWRQCTGSFTREIECFALVEKHGAGTEIEPILRLTDEDIELFMVNHEKTDGLYHLRLRHFNDGEIMDAEEVLEHRVFPAASEILEASSRRLPLQKRHILASEYIQSKAMKVFVEEHQQAYPFLVGMTTRIVDASPAARCENILKE